MRQRLGFFLFILTALGIGLATLVLVRYAQGYRLVFDGKNIFQKDAVKVTSTGLLVATSNPDGASVYIDDQLSSATNSTLDLSPGEYTIKITKEGYLPWEKKLKIQKEVVTQTQALLFPAAPKLESLTATGILSPLVDPTGNSIAYGVASASAVKRNGVFVLNMATRPVLTLRNSSLQIVDNTLDAFSTGRFSWSPSGRELLIATNSKRTYRLFASEFNNTPQNITATLDVIQSQWEKETKENEGALLEGLKPKLAEFISNHIKTIAWSLDGTKILYEASPSGNASSTTVPFIIDPPLIGASTQSQEREIKRARLYVYDTKEDKNFFIKEVDPNLPPPLWLPDGRHLVFIEEKQVKIVEYDGTNKTVVYSGPFEENFLYPWPDGSKLVILTSLNQQAGVAPNLYTVNLK